MRTTAHKPPAVTSRTANTAWLAAPPKRPAGTLLVGALDARAEVDAERRAGQALDPSSPVPARSDAGSDDARDAAPPAVHDVLARPGRALERSDRKFLESRLGHDFSRVRVHHDAAADRSAVALRANAYSVGHHLVFRSDAYRPDTMPGQALLAHELAHVQAGEGGPLVVRREPRAQRGKTPPKRAASEPDASLRSSINQFDVTFDEFLFEREVPARVFKDGKLPPGFSVGTFDGATVSTRWIVTGPPGQDVAALAGLKDPLGAKLAADRSARQGRERSESARTHQAGVAAARERFRDRHDGHSTEVLDNIDKALERATANNPNLLIAYYDYYSDAKLTDDLAKGLGSTSSGDTDLNPRLLKQDPTLGKPSNRKDPQALLGSTLIHEFTHTPQGRKGYQTDQVIPEAKAYAIELFFSERMGDQDRADFIVDRNTNDSMDKSLGGDVEFKKTYRVITALYKVIDSGRQASEARGPGEVSSEQAREMSVDFISHNEADYSKALKDFIAKIPP